MSAEQDYDFQTPMEKAAWMPGGPDRPSSKLAVVSLATGILGWTAFPVFGAIVAAATGHAALGEIRESGERLEGRSMAKAGLWLGYSQIVLLLVAGLIGLAAVGLFIARGEPESATRVEIPSPFIPSKAADQPESAGGVKLVNEMDRADFRLIEAAGLDVKEGEIIACYNAGRPASDPEFALLTTRQILYLKEGRATVFDLKDVEPLDPSTIRSESRSTNGGISGLYSFEAVSRKGPRMRIAIPSPDQGPTFSRALTAAILASKGPATTEAR